MKFSLNPHPSLGQRRRPDKVVVNASGGTLKPKTNPNRMAAPPAIRQRNGDLRLIRASNAKSATVWEVVNANVGGHVGVILTNESAAKVQDAA